MFKNSLSIRQYSQNIKQHSHNYHQLVFPLRGSINVQTEQHTGYVDIGQCLIIKQNDVHAFKAHENARFIVADLFELPTSLLQSNTAVFTISRPLLALLDFIDAQLSHQVDDAIEANTLILFEQLLHQQACLQNYDKRIEKVIHFLNEDLTRQHNLSELSQLACLSLTQFKKVFKDNTKMTVQSYLTELRMNRARSLLVHSDIPVQLAAEKVGYQNTSAFSRKFKALFGQSPSTLSRLK